MTLTIEINKKDKVKYLEEFYLIDYAKLDYYDRYMNYSDETGEDEETTVLHVNLDMDKAAYTDAILVEEFSLDMLVNKHRYLSEDYKPDDLVKINEKYVPYCVEPSMGVDRLVLTIMCDAYDEELVKEVGEFATEKMLAAIIKPIKITLKTMVKILRFIHARWQM